MSDDQRGANLRRIREARGMSQDVLAAAADLTKTTIQGLENSRSKGYGSTWRKLARVLDVEVDELIGQPAPRA